MNMLLDILHERKVCIVKVIEIAREVIKILKWTVLCPARRIQHTVSYDVDQLWCVGRRSCRQWS